MRQLILYYQPECHLCDEAEALIRSAGLGGDFQKVDIESDLALLKQYGIYVPVLKRGDTQAELFWPFDQDELNVFVGNNR